MGHLAKGVTNRRNGCLRRVGRQKTRFYAAFSFIELPGCITSGSLDNGGGKSK